MARIIPAFTQFLDDNGDPLINGWLKLNESGTNNTDKDTFADINETILNTNPLQLTAAGRCPNVFGTGSYNVISYMDDSLNPGNPGQQIEQFDPVGGDETEGAFSTWNAIRIYGNDDIVTASDGLYYRSLVAANQNQDPTTSPAQWEEIIFSRIAATVSGTDTYTVTLNLDSYKIGETYPLIFTNTNTAIAPTLNSDALGAKTLKHLDGSALAPGAIPTEALIRYDGTNGILLNPIQENEDSSITATVASNDLTVGVKGQTLSFANVSLTNGIRESVTFADLSLVVPDGATLGAINAVQVRAYTLVINNAGAAEEAIVNSAGGVDLSEEGLISTTAISTGSDSNDVIYSTTARSNVAYRVVGMVEFTQATAGTYATAPSLIRGMGGNVLNSMSSIGYGQTLQDPTRALATTYYNTTGKPIFGMVTIQATSNNAISINLSLNGGAALQVGGGSPGGSVATSGGSASFIVPPNMSYAVTVNAGTIEQWAEIR